MAEAKVLLEAQSAQDVAEAAAEEAATLGAVVPMAVGVLMHRFSLTRSEALARLRKTASAEGRSLSTQAERLVSAVEELSGNRDLAV